jgi:hypothetical protein
VVFSILAGRFLYKPLVTLLGRIKELE